MLRKELVKLGEEIRFLTITSEVRLAPLSDAPEISVVDPECPGLAVMVTAAEAIKCERCWHHRNDVGTIEAHRSLCSRCVENIDGAGEKRTYA
jgi:isoleucyl-tRNA synthetase